MSITSLRQVSESKIIEDLGKLAKNCMAPFCCSGELEMDATIVYYSKGQWNAATFPSDNEEALICGLMDASSVASFGSGDKTVTDASYLFACKLEPEKFLTSIQLSNTPILRDVIKTLVPSLSTIRAQLYKLNIYGPEVHSRAHVDTPKSPEMFISLVLCLPTQFTGGSLVFHHCKKEVVFDWSSTPGHPAKTIKWAAFFGNIEHEILPVTSGHRVTLTYNLYREDSETLMPGLSQYSPEFTAFKQHFVRTLSNPHFMRTGGILVFRCQHAYILKSLNHQELLPLMLKGVDYSIFVEVQSLGIPIVVKPCVRLNQDENYILNRFRSFKTHEGQYVDEGDESDFNLEQAAQDLFGHFIIKDYKIRWCQPFSDSKWEPAGAVVVYGNEANVGCFYHSAAMYVGVPKWGRCRQKIAGVYEKDEDEGMDDWDKDDVVINVEHDGDVSNGEHDGDVSNGEHDGDDNNDSHEELKDGDDEEGANDMDEEDSNGEYDDGVKNGCSEDNTDIEKFLKAIFGDKEDDKNGDKVFMKLFGQKCDF